MEWEVTVKMDTREAVYTLTAPRYYDARKTGLEMFLRENKIPGRSWEYFSTKKGLIEVSARSLQDRRKEREAPEKEYYLEQVEYLRKALRESKFDRDTKRKGTQLLLKLKGVLDGEKSSTS